MKRFRDFSIRRKLTLTSMLTSGVALLVACATFVAYDYVTFRQAMVGDLVGHADIIGANSTAAIAFNDPEGAAEILRSLRTQPSVIAACLYDREGARLARYARDSEDVTAGAEAELAALLHRDTHRFADGSLLVSRRVELDGATVGTVLIRSDLSALYARARGYALVLAVVLVAATVVALLLMYRLQRVISDPILHLTDVARRVSDEKLYTARAVKVGDDELGLLIDCFNEMLGQIQERDIQLKRHRDGLEEQVAARTEELRAANAQLTAARDRAEQANRAKSAFLANMSHEIRTPMTAIVGYADMMLEPDQTLSDRQDCLQVIRRNAHHLLEIINDILDLSKIEAEKMTVERIRCELPQIVADVVSLMRPRALEKGLDFRLGFAGRLPRQIASDPIRLKQILMNLVGNAIKFTERGHIEVHVGCRTSASHGTVELRVQDTGIGMTPEQVARLFQPFTQADESMTRRFGGTGLGLVISKRLAEALGGNISVQSERGVGSTFAVTVDAGAVGEGTEWIEGLTESLLVAPADPVPNRVTRLSGRILLAEDGPDNQRLISTHLRRAGADVVIAENGRVAVEQARASRFDLILMDMQMPEMDGYSATTTLRRDGQQSVPIVALTAHAMTGDRERCLLAGCTDYLTKPVDRDLLLMTVAAHMHRGRRLDEASAGAAAPPRPSPEPVRPDATGASAGEPADAGLVRSMFASDREMSGILAEFVAELPGHVERMQSLLRGQQLDELRRLLHQLKGSGGGYGFGQITELAARAEADLQQHGAVDSVAAQVQSLVALLRRVEGYDRRRETSAAITSSGAGTGEG